MTEPVSVSKPPLILRLWSMQKSLFAIYLKSSIFFCGGLKNFEGVFESSIPKSAIVQGLC
jgi:hypothetical protein